MNATKQIDASERLALSAREVAKLLGVSQRHVWKLLAAGRMPKPFRLGRSVKWNYALLRAWVDADCPAVERFEIARAAH
jgi:excisionase family DNA binding protein